MDLLTLLATNFGPYAGIAALTITLANRIAKLTPTDTDNKIVNTIGKIFAIIGIKVPDVNDK